MRTAWLNGVIVTTVTSAVLLAVVMQAVHICFELFGSVPDVDGCGFLAGNLFALLFIYPICAAVISGTAGR